MQIQAEVRPLPPGIAVAAQRRHHNGQEIIVVLLADDGTGPDKTDKRQGMLDRFLEAINALLEAPEARGPVTVPLAS